MFPPPDARESECAGPISAALALLLACCCVHGIGAGKNPTALQALFVLVSYTRYMPNP